MPETLFKRVKDLPSAHLIGSGTAMCAGCGGLGAIKEVSDVFGSNTIFVNAAGCMSLLAVYPFTPFQGSWMYTAMASAPAGAQGVRDALDILKEQGKLPVHEDMNVAVLAGDGSSSGMGLSATSAAIDRGLDFLYLCYDNEGYGNTGQQASASTPHGARTSTSRFGWQGGKKDLFGIWAANRPAYAATITAAEPLDLSRKTEVAKQLTGPRLLLALSPCPTGWGFDPQDSIEIGKLAVKSGIWPLKEYRDGKIIHTKVPHSRVPVDEYLSRQKRFDHLFTNGHKELRRNIQRRVDDYWARVESSEKAEP